MSRNYFDRKNDQTFRSAQIKKLDLISEALQEQIQDAKRTARIATIQSWIAIAISILALAVPLILKYF